MNNDFILNKLLNIIAEVIDVDINILNLNTKREDFDTWDSLATLIIFMRLEEEFNVKFKEDDFKLLDSIDKIYKKITEGNK